MNKSNDHLFQLIKSLSSTEKRYFKRNASIAKDASASNYLKLYDALNKMEVYDETKLKKKPFIKHLASEKKYLYEAILRSIRSYNTEESIKAQIYDLLLDVRYLMQRGLYGQEEKRLKKAERLATEMGDLTMLLEINGIKREILMFRKPKTYDSDLKDLIDEKNQLLLDIKCELEVKDLSDKLQGIILKNHSLKTQEERQRLQTDFWPQLQNYSERKLTLNGEKKLYNAFVFYHRLEENNERAEFFANKGVAWWHQNPLIMRQDFRFYINTISNYIIILIRNNKVEQVMEQLEKIDVIKMKSFHAQKAAFEKSSMSKFLFFFKIRDLDSLGKMIPEIEKNKKVFSNTNTPYLTLEGNIIVYYFLTSNWTECEKRIEFLLVSKRMEQREGVLRLLRVLLLITYYELNKIEKVETYLRSTQRYFEKTLTVKAGYDFELLTWFRRLINTPVLDQKNFFKDFKNFLMEEQKNEENIASLLAFEELRAWLDSHIQNLSIKEVFQKK